MVTLERFRLQLSKHDYKRIAIESLGQHLFTKNRASNLRSSEPPRLRAPAVCVKSQFYVYGPPINLNDT
jgi:hypothetical protein